MKRTGGGNEERQKYLTLVLVQTRGNKAPNLRRHDWEGDAHGTEEGDLDLSKESFVQGGEDHPSSGLSLGRVGERLNQKIVDVAGHRVTQEERDDHADERIKQPLAQLDQVLQQRHLGVIEIIRRHALGLRHRGFGGFRRCGFRLRGGARLTRLRARGCFTSAGFAGRGLFRGRLTGCGLFRRRLAR